MRGRVSVLGASVLAGLLLLACGHGKPIPPEDFLLHIGVDADVVEVGESFEVEVKRVWRKDLTPPAWDDAWLSPLVLHPTSTRRREDAHRVEEVRRFRAQVFTLDDVVVPGITQAALAEDGRTRVVTRSEPIHLGVMAVLDPDHPGDPELPGPLVGEGPPGVLFLLPGMLAIAFLVVAATRGRAPRPARTPIRAAPSPSEGLLVRLEALRGTAPPDPDTARRQVDELSTLLRTHVVSAHGIAAWERTSEEILDVLDPVAVKAIGPALRGIDAVRYGTGPVLRPAMLAWIDAIEAEIRAGGAA